MPGVENSPSLLLSVNQLPALKKVRRLVASNKKDSFVGTDLSYGDIIGHKVQEWHHVLVKEETIDGQACYVVESTPHSDAVQEQSGYRNP